MHLSVVLLFGLREESVNLIFIKEYKVVTASTYHAIYSHPCCSLQRNVLCYQVPSSKIYTLRIEVLNRIRDT